MTTKEELKQMAQLAAIQGLDWLVQFSDGNWWMFSNKPDFNKQTGQWWPKNHDDGFRVEWYRENFPEYFKKPKLDSHITIRVNKHIKAAIKTAATNRGLSITDYLLSLVGNTVDFSKQIFEVQKILTND